MDILTLADQIAQEAHKGQRDKGGRPYINHPRYVAKCVDGVFFKAAALLHDVIEDSDFTADDLRNRGIPDSVVTAVEVLTKKKGEPYNEYLSRISYNEIAKTVKIFDLKHNSDLSRIEHPDENDLARLNKYQRALEFLLN